MSDRTLPERPDLDQLKRQAKELLKTTGLPRLRDAQRALAQQYGFVSWDALRTHVERVTGRTGSHAKVHRGLKYGDEVPDVVVVSGPMTREHVGRLNEQGVSGVKIDISVPREQLAHLVEIPSLRRLDLSNRADLEDTDLAFLEAMPWLTAISLARSGRIGDRAIGYLRGHQHLEQVNLQWTATGDASVAALSSKPALTRLVLGTQLSDTGTARLTEFPALVLEGAADSFLSISGARTLTDVALRHIGELKGVAALDVHMSAFGSPHYTARGVAHLRGMTSLEELSFHGALATDAVLRELAGIPRLRLLHCQDIVSGDDGFVALAARDTLEVLNARVCARLTDRGFTAIARLPRLTSITLGGPRVSDRATAPLADAGNLEEIGPILFGDEAFVHIARVSTLRKLTNMYNRATTDAATRCLRDHARLAEYAAFGTQITDESLRILAGLPRLEAAVFENCAAITDEGLRVLTQSPGLRRISVWSCKGVAGTWRDSIGEKLDAKWEPATAKRGEGYRAETLIDYPDLPWPADAATPRGVVHSAALLSRLGVFGVDAEFVDEGLRLSVAPGVDPRWVSVVTRDVFSVPLRIELVVRPMTELRLVFAAHNRFLVFDDRGCLTDPTPWFLKLDAEKGEANEHDIPRIAADEWARVTLEMNERERHVLVNGARRHTWHGDFAGIRSRIGIGLQRSALTVRELTVESVDRTSSRW